MELPKHRRAAQEAGLFPLCSEQAPASSSELGVPRLLLRLAVREVFGGLGQLCSSGLLFLVPLLAAALAVCGVGRQVQPKLCATSERLVCLHWFGNQWGY